jgi:hypothetical protein
VLNLLVYFDNKDQRAAAEQIVGRFLGSLKNPADFGVPTQFRIIVRDDSARIIRDENRTAVGINGIAASFFIRRIDEFILTPGIYFIQVTPVGDFSSFRGFRTSLDLTRNAKATPIRD